MRGGERPALRSLHGTAGSPGPPFPAALARPASSPHSSNPETGLGAAISLSLGAQDNLLIWWRRLLSLEHTLRGGQG